jgi:hypothetical protein
MDSHYAGSGFVDIADEPVVVPGSNADLVESSAGSALVESAAKEVVQSAVEPH